MTIGSPTKHMARGQKSTHTEQLRVHIVDIWRLTAAFKTDTTGRAKNATATAVRVVKQGGSLTAIVTQPVAIGMAELACKIAATALADPHPERNVRARVA